MNAPQFWAVRREFMDRYGVTYEGYGEPAPSDPAAVQAQATANLQVAMSVLRRDDDLVNWLSDRLLAIADTVPSSLRLPARLARGLPDRRIFDVSSTRTRCGRSRARRRRTGPGWPRGPRT